MRTLADRREPRVQTLADELELKSGHGRVVGQSAEWLDVLKKATQVDELCQQLLGRSSQVFER